jgi:uncharacterized phage-associated protein
MNTGFTFAYKKAAQALNFFAIQNNGHIEKLHALKLVFFADRYHLRKYGRPITNDQYWAMRLGPVPSGVKDIFELDSASSEERHYAGKYFKQGPNPHSITTLAPVDTQVLSATDMEALQFAWNTFGSHTGIVEKTHSYPEWIRHEAAVQGGSTREPMDYLDFLEDPPKNVNPCYPLSADERASRREQLVEMTNAVALWR